MAEATDGLQEAPEPAGLDALLTENLKDYGKEPEVAASAEPTEAPADTPSEPKIDATGRAHAADGKFAPKKSAEPATPSEPEPAVGDAKPATDPAIQPAPAVQPIEAPARWSEAEKAEFAKLPREAQQVLSDRHKAMEADYTRKTQEVAETRKGIEPLLGEVQRLNPLLQHMGYTPQQFLAESGAVATNLLSGNPSDRAGAIAYLVQHRNIPIAEVLNALGVPLPNAGDGSQQPDPAFLQLRQDFTSLQQQLRQMNERRQVEETQRAQAEFDALGAAKDESGQPKFPHFARVKTAMLQLVANNQAPTWDDAYTKAVRLDDELYKQTVETERASVAAAAEQARLAAVEKAKKAQPVKLSGGSPSGGSKLTGLDAHLSGALERAGFGE